MVFSRFRDILLQRAARKFAHRLAPQLRRNHGIGTLYTADQIRVAAGACGLPSRYLSIGYAAFLPPDEFRIVADAGRRDSYQQLRSLFFRYYVYESLSPTPRTTPANPDATSRNR